MLYVAMWQIKYAIKTMTGTSRLYPGVAVKRGRCKSGLRSAENHPGVATRNQRRYFVPDDESRRGRALPIQRYGILDVAWLRLGLMCL